MKRDHFLIAAPFIAVLSTGAWFREGVVIGVLTIVACLAGIVLGLRYYR